MAKVRIHVLAKTLGLDNKKILEVFDAIGVEYKTVSSSVEEEVGALVQTHLASQPTPENKAKPAIKRSEPKTTPEPSVATPHVAPPVAEEPIVEAIVEKTEEIKPIVETPIVATPIVETPIVATPAVAPVVEPPKTQPAIAKPTETKPVTTKKPEPVKPVVPEKPKKPRESLPHRPPVITVMGHVDHGKTSLLDYIRKAKVAEKEAGGITQHVGAFEAITKTGKVIFIDTPGHEAFTSIRQRGANVADIAVIVIAADDSIMPQTREAVAHARAAKVPIVVAINKTDLPGVNTDKVKQDLFNLELVPEEFGGDTIVVPVSAKTGAGVDDLLENLSLVAELEDLRADPEGDLSGVIIEAKIDKQAGVLATVLIQEGTLKVGDFLVVGEIYGKVRAMTDSNGERQTVAGPGTAVQILGFGSTPIAGELVAGASNEHVAREIIEAKKDTRRDTERAAEKPASSPIMDINALLGQPNQKEVRDLNIILRADTQGSLEAIQGILAKASEGNEDVNLNIMFSGIGAPTEGDVLLASTAEALILGFSVVPSGGVKKMAETKKIEIKTYRIIYELIDEIKRLLRSNQEPIIEERAIGKAEIRMIIPISKVGGNIAGCYVTEGKVVRNARVKVMRRGKEIHRGQVSGLRRFKDDAREVTQGYECGINVSNFDNYEVGDIMEFSEMVEVAAA